MEINVRHSNRDAAWGVLDAIREYSSQVEIHEPNGEELNITIVSDDPRNVALRVFGAFLNHPTINDIRFTRP